MKPFEYHAPESVEEAVALLAEPGSARPFAGGTDLLVQLRAGRLELGRVVDIKCIPELNRLDLEPGAGLTIGAAVPCCRIYEDEAVRTAYPGLIDAAAIIGGIATQGRASFGGNLCNASPSGDSIPALIVHRAICLVAGPGGRRTVPVERFCTAPGRTVLGPGELLVAIHVPPPGPRFGARYLRFTPRNEMDIAIVGAGAAIALAEDGTTVASARVALGAVAPTPLLVEEAAASLVGKPISDNTIAEAAARAQEAARPIDDLRGTAAQRQHLVGVLVKRALQGAV